MKKNQDSPFLVVVKELNKTLKKYEPYYAFAKRLPYLEDIRCESFRDWIDIRFNFEIFSNIPELSEYEAKFCGELFCVRAIYDLNEPKCKFSEVEIGITDTPRTYIGDGNYLEELERVKEIVGGSVFKFNNNLSRIKLTIL